MNNYSPQKPQNSLVKQKAPFSAVIQSEKWQAMINNTLGDKKKASRFIANIVTAVSMNPTLSECDNGTILSAGLLGETLDLSPSPTLGHFYLLPFNDKEKGKVATFVLGYKGYIQLAIRSGQYKKINVIAIKEGELKKFDPLNEEISAIIIDDEIKREMAQTVGYYAMFELTNGFRKAMYWSKDKMETHAKTYSKGYAAKKGYTFWEKDFDGMAYKTMLRQLISKWGIMSIDMQNAYENDDTFKTEGGNAEYVDLDEEIAPQSIEEPKTQEEKSNALFDKHLKDKIEPKADENGEIETPNLFGSK